MPKISVIIPVYNVAPYLRRCLDSVLAQTFTDFEVLVVDDGSTDGSEAICDEYAVKDNRIRVFHKQNAGVSSARNLGLDEAKGEWVCFVDSDDYYNSEEALHILYIRAVSNRNVDLVRGEYIAVDQEESPANCGVKNKKHRSKYSDIPMNADSFVANVIDDEFFFFLYLIRRSYFDDIRFPINKVYLEDVYTLMKLMLKQPQCIYIPFAFYAYRKRSDSLSYSPTVQRVKDTLSMCDEFFTFSLQTKSSLLRTYCIRKSISAYYSTLQILTDTAYSSNRKEMTNLLDLESYRRMSLQRIRESGMKTNLLYYLMPPLCSIRVIKTKECILNRLYKIKYELLGKLKA